VLGVNQRPTHANTGFRHKALLYAGDDEFVSASAEFIGEGLDAHEPTFVVLDADKTRRLRDALGADAARVVFADMERVGRNPARILPAWQQFIDDHRGRGRLRGLGEPIWPGRSAAELVECRLHESLLNMAFDGRATLELLCPYDVDALAPEVIEGARHTHPVVGHLGDDRPSPSFDAGHDATRIFTEALPGPAVAPTEMTFAVGPLHRFRRFVVAEATAAGLVGSRAEDIVLAANEIASNSLVHGGGRGTVRVWTEDGSFICEIRDGGQIDDLLIGRVRPDSEGTCGRGMWMANQLCDLVQVRSSQDGTVVRLHMRTRIE
jgi:anti-sigma regulatory factor (Ser/Thr protein kinase)